MLSARPMLPCLAGAALLAPTAATAAPTTTVPVATAPGQRVTLAEPWNTDRILPAGDANADGRTDLLVRMSRPGGTQANAIVFGGRRTRPVNLNTIGGDGYYILNTGPLIPVDDVNGDGRDDLYQPGGSNSRPTVIYGKSSTSTINRWTLTSEQGAWYDATRPAPTPGSQMVGDFNGDGILDEVFGAAGSLRVAFGTATAPPARSGRGFLIKGGFDSGIPCGDYGGYLNAAVPLGDVTGDGKDDLGVPGGQPPVGKPGHLACVVKGRTSTTDVDLKRLAETGDGFTVFLGEGRTVTQTGIARGSAGAIGGVGDLNGDGIDDFAVATNAERYLQRGLYVFPGGPRSANIDATKPGTPHLRLLTNRVPSDLLPVEDLTGDGRDELAFSLWTGPKPDPFASEPFYAVAGRPLTGAVHIDNLGTTALKILPTAGSRSIVSPDGSGRSLHDAGDFDADGRQDVAYFESTGSGAAQLETIHVLYGSLR